MRIVVVGLGKVGRALTAQLTAENNDIVVIDQNPELIEDIVNIYDVRGVPGNGGCYEVQKEAFEDGADLLIATTSSDEINILACLVVKKLGVAHTIARIRNPVYAEETYLLREELGFTGVTVTDDLYMDGIRDFVDVEGAAVQAVLAGNDLLCCTDFEVQIPAVLAAVEQGVVPETRVDEAVRRVLTLKQKLGLLG